MLKPMETCAEVVVVGSLNADLVVRTGRRPAPGETVIGDSFDVLPGGKGANQALVAALVGRRTDPGILVALIGATGDDANAGLVTAGLASAGVDLRAVQRVASSSTGVAAITVGDDGDNAIIVVPGANSAVTSDYVRQYSGLIAAAAVVVVQMEVPLDGVLAAAGLTRGRLIVNLAPAKQVPPDLLLRADPLVVNEHEAAAALAILTLSPDPAGTDRSARTGHEQSPAPHAQPHRADTPGTADITDTAEEAACVAGLLAAGVPSVVLTLGARGCLVGTASGIQTLPAVKVRAVDTTGAGDAFTGAIAARLAAGDDLPKACKLATRVAAYCVQQPGAQPQPA